MAIKLLAVQFKDGGGSNGFYEPPPVDNDDEPGTKTNTTVSPEVHW